MPSLGKIPSGQDLDSRVVRLVTLDADGVARVRAPRDRRSPERLESFERQHHAGDEEQHC
jgi:hypothetical protein